VRRFHNCAAVFTDHPPCILITCSAYPCPRFLQQPCALFTAWWLRIRPRQARLSSTNLRKHTSPSVTRTLEYSLVPALSTMGVWPQGSIQAWNNNINNHAGPSAWNSLPQHIREITDTTRFKRHLKTVLFQRAFVDF